MATEKIKETDGLVIPSGQLAKMFGLTVQRIGQLERDGVLVKSGHGRYNLSENIKRYVDYIKSTYDVQKVLTDEQDIDVDHERALKVRTEREILEIKRNLLIGESHASEDVERVLNDMLMNFKSKLVGFPTRVAPILVSREKATEIQEILMSEVIEVLNELSEYKAEDFYNSDVIDMEELQDDEPEKNKKKNT